MRYVPGRDLGRLISARGALPADDAASLIAEVAGGLDAVHAAGLVHRDVKPANVLVAEPAPGDESPTAYLTDFGLAKLAASTSGLTATGEVIGTVDYIAPEQIEGRRVDARADVYALGCVLFHAVTGVTLAIPTDRNSQCCVRSIRYRNRTPTTENARMERT